MKGDIPVVLTPTKKHVYSAAQGDVEMRTEYAIYSHSMMANYY